MSPREPRDFNLMITALAVVLIAAALIVDSRRVGRIQQERRIERNRVLQLEEDLEKSRRSLDGALEKITELQGGQPAGDGAE